VKQTRSLNDPREQTWRTLQFMQMRLTAELTRQLADNSNLSYPDYIVLVALTAQPDGRMRIFELTKQIGWEKSRLSHHVGRMSDRRLVTREKCDSDRRGAFVVVTAHGRRELDAAAPGHVDAVHRLFIDHLSEEQLTAIRDASEATLAKLAEVERP
jgi:DNA-binding MarR family transcriptional regulator